MEVPEQPPEARRPVVSRGCGEVGRRCRREADVVAGDFVDSRLTRRRDEVFADEVDAALEFAFEERAGFGVGADGFCEGWPAPFVFGRSASFCCSS